MFQSSEHVHQALTDVGYITDTVTATAVYLAASLQKPLLLEGPAGSGKTELAYAVARAMGAPLERLQCYEGITEEKAIGKFDEGLQRLYLDTVTRGGGASDWASLGKQLSALDFFAAGPLLKALQYKSPCVLLIDELDKVNHSFEATLLEALSVFRLSVPRLGTITAASIPFTVLTSNEERRLGDPIRRRSLYVRVEHPTAEREGDIVARRTPEAGAPAHRLIAGFAKALRAYSLEKPPSVEGAILLSLASVIFALLIATIPMTARRILLGEYSPVGAAIAWGRAAASKALTAGAGAATGGTGAAAGAAAGGGSLATASSSGALAGGGALAPAGGAVMAGGGGVIPGVNAPLTAPPHTPPASGGTRWFGVVPAGGNMPFNVRINGTRYS